MRVCVVRYFLFFLVLCSCGLYGATKKTVCLSMLVKNNEATIRHSLESVESYIDYWVIVDLGSSDKTLQIVRECLKNKPGEIHTCPWLGIEKTYNEALRLAKPKADYIFFMSGEASLQVASTFSFPELSKDVYCIMWHQSQNSGLRRQIIKSSLPWHWKVGYKRELDYLSCDVPCSSEVLCDMHYIIGDMYQGQQKATLFASSSSYTPEESKKIFQMAESFRGLGDKEKALEWYKKRVALGQNGQDLFWAILHIGRLQEELKYPLTTVIDGYYQAYIAGPEHVEPIYCLSHLYNHLKEHLLAYECIKGWEYIIAREKKGQVHLNGWMLDYGLKLELLVSTFYLKKYDEFLQVSEQLLALDTLPEEIRAKVVTYRKFVLSSNHE